MQSYPGATFPLPKQSTKPPFTQMQPPPSTLCPPRVGLCPLCLLCAIPHARRWFGKVMCFSLKTRQVLQNPLVVNVYRQGFSLLPQASNFTMFFGLMLHIFPMIFPFFKYFCPVHLSYALCGHQVKFHLQKYIRTHKNDHHETILFL